LRGVGRGEKAPEADRTRVMTAPVATPPPEPTAPGPGGELVARLRARAADTPPHLRAVAGVCVLILILVVLAGLAAGGEDPADDRIPAQTPPELEQPLQDLHDAVLEAP
jgi:eukaryotic-like serine/threonine-protein kinase